MIDDFRRFMILRYLVASVAALVVDVAVFLILMGLGMLPVVASALGYAFGIIAHWLLSSRTVFTQTIASERGPRNRQKSLFVVSALVGLGLTALIVGLGTAIGVDPRLSKLVAVAVSFMTIWIFRKHVVFR